MNDNTGTDNQTDTSTDNASSEAKSIEDQMLEFIEEGRSGDSAGDPEPKEGSEEEKKDPPQTDGEGKTAEGDKKEPEADKKKEEAEDEKDPQRKSRWGRLRAKLDEKDKIISETSEKVDRAVVQANLWRNRYKALETEVGSLLQRLGVNVPETDLENIALKVQAVDGTVTKEATALTAKRREEQEVRQMVEKKSEEYAEQAVKLASKYEVDPADVLEMFASTMNRGWDMERTAKALRADAISSGKIKPKPRVQTTTKIPPKTISTANSGGRMDFPNTEEGMLAYLEAKRKANS
jgi:hypothetical protein